MVRSRALFFPKQSLSSIASIGHALSFLRDNFDDSAPYEDVEVEIDGNIGAPHLGLVNALVQGNAGTVVWAEDNGFEAAIANLWHNIWPQARATLSFRMAFSPKDIPDRPTIATTMSSLEARWIDFPIVKEDSALLDRAAAMLAGATEGHELRILIGALNAHVKSFGQLHQLVDVLEALEADVGFSDTVAALRLTAYFSPAQSDGVAQKARLIEKSASQLADADVDEVRTSRNLVLDGFETAETFWKALERWASTKLWNDEPSGIGQILSDTAAEGPTESWKKHINKGLSLFLKKMENVAPVVWSVLEVSPSALRRIADLSQDQVLLDEALAAKAPESLQPIVAEALLDEARKLKLPELHGVCSARCLAPEHSIRTHLAVEAATARSIELALSRATAEQIALAAVATTDERVLDLAAEHAAKRPGVLREIDVDDATWRRLWLKTLTRNEKAIDAPRDVRGSYFRLLDLLVAGTPSDEDMELVRRLSETDLANIWHHPSRENIWAALPNSSRSKIIHATADAWFASFLRGDHASAPEPELTEAIVAFASQSNYLERLASPPLKGMEFFRVFPEVPEIVFIEWLRSTLQDKFAQDLAEAVGVLIATRSWKKSAELLAGQARAGRHDLRPAIEFCRDLLDMYTRFWLDMLGPTADFLKWRILEDIGAELFPVGPGDKSLWQRAGGKPADIPIAPSGREAWHIVVTDMERGSKKMNARSLLDAMLSEYPGNNVLRQLKQRNFFW
ncbi:hypothetical protein J2861_003012 [Agrobacterium tumefaciens]|nr:hypothetical protein [Agrobacterium tumefaciens]